ncbi:MAG: hypothetical protein IJ458_02865 [Clostridia bacterium]|nr:hypothetical protein [Clostridia bacterium]
MSEEQIKKDKEKLVRYLHPTKEIRGLMCNDIYQELLEIIPMETCISNDNINNQIREKNLEFVRGAIKGFLLGNVSYQQVLFEYYKYNNLDWIVRDILIGFVLYISTLCDEFKDMDILKDKQSICYGEIFILDLIS